MLCLFFFLLSIKLLAQSYSFGYNLVAHPFSETKDVKEVYYLDTDLNASLFRTETQKKSDSLISISGLGLGLPNNFDEQIYIIKNLKKSTIYRLFISPTSRDKFFVNIDGKLNWKIQSEITNIGNYICQKAQVTYGGRNWTAFFTKDIPINDGPYIFQGLPGLIVYISDESQDYVFQLFSVKKAIKTTPYYAIGKSITWDEFNKVRENYFYDPFIYVKQKNLKTATDDGNGGVKRVDFREMTKIVRDRILAFDNPIELNHKVNYK